MTSCQELADGEPPQAARGVQARPPARGRKRTAKAARGGKPKSAVPAFEKIAALERRGARTLQTPKGARAPVERDLLGGASRRSGPFHAKGRRQDPPDDRPPRAAQRTGPAERWLGGRLQAVPD